jgi:hypothetical protein
MPVQTQRRISPCQFSSVLTGEYEATKKTTADITVQTSIASTSSSHILHLMGTMSTGPLCLFIDRCGEHKSHQDTRNMAFISGHLDKRLDRSQKIPFAGVLTREIKPA